MPAALQAAIALASVAALLGVILAVKRVGGHFDWSAEVQRKLVHIATGLYTLTLPWLFADDWPVYMLVAISLVVLMVLRLPRVARQGIGSTLHGVERQSWGDFLLTLSVGVTFFLSEGAYVLYVLPMAVLTLADAAAALAGTAYGKRFFVVEEGRKSVEGVVAFFMVTLIIAMFCLLLLTDIPRQNVIAVALAVAAIGTLIEAESWRGLDNFFLPVGLSFYLKTNLWFDAAGLAAELGLLAAALVGVHYLGRRWRLTPHTARVYVIVAFLFLTATEIQNTVPPMLALAAHALAWRRAPCAAPHPHLDIATAMAFVGVGWRALGMAVGLNALLFYASSMAAMAMLFLTLAAGSLPAASRLVATALSGLLLVALTVPLVRINPVGALWTGHEWFVTGGTIAVAGLMGLVAQRSFLRYRALRVSLVAPAVPLAAYLMFVLSRNGGPIG